MCPPCGGSLSRTLVACGLFFVGVRVRHGWSGCGWRETAAHLLALALGSALASAWQLGSLAGEMALGVQEHLRGEAKPPWKVGEGRGMEAELGRDSLTPPSRSLVLGHPTWSSTESVAHSWSVALGRHGRALEPPTMLSPQLEAPLPGIPQRPLKRAAAE